MRSGFKIGKIFGISIHVDSSWLLIFILTSWNLATSFGNMHRNWSMWLTWGLGIVGALLFFASVLAHELAHSLVARARGIQVRSIKLHLFGGVSNIQQEPQSPGTEFIMAVVGPLTSLIIGGILLLIFGLNVNLGKQALNITQFLSQISPGLTLVFWLGSSNVLVGVFNLIPGFPLDGGRILRSIFWALSNNLKSATRWASWIGRIVAWLLIISGIAMSFGVRIPLFGTGLSAGLWLSFIGWFLHNSATQSYRQLVARDILEDVMIEEIMRKNPPRVAVSCTVADLVHSHVMQSDDYAFPVIDEGKLVGIVTLDDVRAVDREKWQVTSVQDIMTHRESLVTITPASNAREALDLLGEYDVRQLPVMDGDHLAGLLRRRDILKWLQLESGHYMQT
ncbi:MAG: site-2 protease family protein [Anaerolineae bacterium]|nr:site-2 protease family protein [Anaerolineae bacterium]